MPPAATIADFGTGVSPILADGVVVLLHDEMKRPEDLALDADDRQSALGKEAAVDVGLRHAGRLGYARRASRSPRPDTAG